MSDKPEDAGVITAPLERFNTQRLPRTLEIKDKADRGECLEEAELAFLQQLLSDAKEPGPLLARHPEYADLTSRVAALYREITEKALENAQRRRAARSLRPGRRTPARTHARHGT